MRYGKSECPSNTKYQFQGLEDQVTGQRYVECCMYKAPPRGHIIFDHVNHVMMT